MSNTLLEVVHAVGEKLDDLEVGQATGGSTTTLLDTNSDSPFAGGDGPSLFKDGWLHIYAGTNSPAERRVSLYTPGSQQLTVANAYTLAIDTTSQYEYRQLFRRAEIVGAINRALTQRLYYHTTEPIGLMADGDGSMEEAGTAKWTGSGNITLTKESSENDFILSGQQSLRLDPTATGQYAESQILLVAPGETITIEALVLPYLVSGNTSAASLVVRDLDNGANIAASSGATTAAYTTDGARTKLLYGSYQIPDGCGRISIRLTEATNGARAFWDDVVAIRPQDELFTLPSWVGGPEDIEWIWERRRIGGNSPSSPYRRDLRKVVGQTYFHDRQGSGFAQIEAPGYAGRCLFVSGYRPYPELATDAQTTNAPFHWLLAASIVELLEPAVGRAGKYRDNQGVQEKLDYWSVKLDQANGANAPDTVTPFRLSGR